MRDDGVAAALVSAVLFGLGTPVAKLLLPGTGPLALAALLYLGAGIGLAAVRLARRAGGTEAREAPLRRGDLPLVAAIVVAGGVVAPVLLLRGLEQLPAAEASLLLNLETPFTVLLAMVVFGEHVGARGVLATALIVLGGAALSGGSTSDVGARWLGSALVAAACAGWAIDNNLTQRLSLRDPIAIALVKTLAAGTINLPLALATGSALPAAPRILGALALGSVSYGLSLALAIRAMRVLGAARQAALFAVAPFVGALAAVPLLGDRPPLLAVALMAAGVGLLVRERHEHAHVHEAFEHDHLHVHDVHHEHAHPDGVDPREPHAHPHRHERVAHAHPHVSDAHHRHRH